MDKNAVIETAQRAADSVAQLQLWSSIIIGLVAIGVPAAFAYMDRRAKRIDARLRARSFALSHISELENIFDSLKVHVAANPRGKPVVDQSAMASGMIAFRDTKLPVADLYLLDTAAAGVQAAVASAQKAISYWNRRPTLASQGKNIMLMDIQQSNWMRDAHEELEVGIQKIHDLF